MIIEVFPTGGNGGFTYLWSNGETNAQVSGLAGGDWFEYLYLINNFAKTCESKKIKTFLCKWSNE